MIVNMWQATFNGEKWRGNLSVNQEPNEYDTVLMETVESEKKMRMV